MFDEASVGKLWDYMDGVKNDMTREEKEAAEVAAAAVAEAKEAPTGEQAGEAKPAGKSKKGARVCVRVWSATWFVWIHT